MTRRFAINPLATVARGEIGEHGRGHVCEKMCCGDAAQGDLDAHLAGSSTWVNRG